MDKRLEAQRKADVKRLVETLRRIQSLAEFDIQTGLVAAGSCLYQVEADARAALLPFTPEPRPKGGRK